MKILKKFIPYLIYLGLLALAIVVGTFVTYGDQFLRYVFATLILSVTIIAFIALLALAIALPFKET